MAIEAAFREFKLAGVPVSIKKAKSRRRHLAGTALIRSVVNHVEEHNGKTQEIYASAQICKMARTLQQPESRVRILNYSIQHCNCGLCGNVISNQHGEVSPSGYWCEYTLLYSGKT
ncbi:hypothetical protein HZ326_0819 [Fusarium oxysporum f. sp. albedinis]|nr:hypothetical protein HZ326_0819 [Fusarium oxysporum f. sp. albedinis]